MKKNHKKTFEMFLFIVTFLLFSPLSVRAADDQYVTIRSGESFNYKGSGDVYVTVTDLDTGKNGHEYIVRIPESEAKSLAKDGNIAFKNTISEKCESKLKELKLGPSMFGVSMSYDGDSNTFVMDMNVPDSYKGSSKGKVKFSIPKIQILEIPQKESDPVAVKNTYTDLQATFGISTATRLEHGKSITFQNNQSNPVRYRVYLMPDGFIDSDLKSACGEVVSFTIYKIYDFYGKPINTKGSYTEKFEDLPVTSGEIKCDGSVQHAENSFEAMYCKDLNAAKRKGIQTITFTDKENAYAKRYGENAAEKFKCDPFTTIVKDLKISDSIYYNEKNSSYLLGTAKYTVTGEDYVYNYGGQDKSGNSYTKSLIDTEPVSCEVTCNEVVSVKYGPPVASKAGLCFEYKVEVISRVNCYMTKQPNLPRNTTIQNGEITITGDYCTPSPGCDHGNGYVDITAGPNEDYEACVSKCDGGKYTSKCSTKCYKEVYGKKTTSKKTTVFDFDMNASPILEKTGGGDGMGQYINLGGWIVWRPSTDLARWYIQNEVFPGKGDRCMKGEADGGGIPAVCGCSARCRWNGCAGKVYLNPYSITGYGKEYRTAYTDGTFSEEGELERDARRNIERYKKVVKECQTYSKCSTNKAEFSISVSYNTGKKKENVYFPYTSKNDKNTKDTIQRNTDTGLVSCTSTNANSVILKSGGCYACGSGNAMTAGDTTDKVSSSKWYQTEWSFSGTWINNKTGEISYNPNGKSSGWRKQDKKFCLPFNAKNVNEKWWNYYQTKLFGPGTENTNRFSYNDPEYLNSIKECSNNAGDVVKAQQEKALNFTQNDVKNIDWNINAKTRKFGWFAWNINIDCFYAINDKYLIDESTPDNIKQVVECLGGTNEKMRVRSIELTNLFPEPNGATLTTTDKTGRAPGFNWSAYATNEKTEENFSSPSEYTKWVQSKGYTVYSDNYLDYEVTLTKEKINELKKVERNYTDFEGEIIENDVLNYSSSLLRKDLKEYTKVPTTTALKCNNMRNYQSDECAEFGKGGVD